MSDLTTIYSQSVAPHLPNNHRKGMLKILQTVDLIFTYYNANPVVRVAVASYATATPVTASFLVMPELKTDQLKGLCMNISLAINRFLTVHQFIDVRIQVFEKETWKTESVVKFRDLDYGAFPVVDQSADFIDYDFSDPVTTTNANAAVASPAPPAQPPQTLDKID